MLSFSVCLFTVPVNLVYVKLWGLATNIRFWSKTCVIQKGTWDMAPIHHIRFWYLWCCGCPGLRGRPTWQRLTLVLHEFLSNGLTPSRLHIVISFLTHADHVFLGLPRFLVTGNPNRVIELMHQKTNKKVSWKRWSKSGLSCSIVSTRDKSIVWMNWNSSSSMSGAKNTQFFWWGYWPVVRKTSSVCPC